MVIVIIYLAIVALLIVSMWKIYEKAGQPGWACIIPIYSTIVMLDIVRKPWWWILIMFFVPIVNLVFVIWMINRLSKSFGYDAGFTIGLLLLPIVFFPILGLGKAQYKALDDASPIPAPEVPATDEAPAE